jgi:glycosyltransferase involved in cell wall biosynthesis
MPTGVARHPLVSFLIVAHNAGGYLTPCLRSVQNQTYSNIEIVLVDNASTDGSVEEAVDRIRPDCVIRVVRCSSNLGWAAGAVFGLPACRGEFVARLDADDLSPPDRTERQLDYLHRFPSIDAVGGDVMMIDRSGKCLGLRPALRTAFLRKYGSKWHVGTNHSTLMLRQRAIQERFYNTTMFTNADYEYIEWIARGGKLGCVGGVMAWYRQHDSSITRRLTSLQRLSGAEFRRRVALARHDLARRDLIATEDFSSLKSDSRLGNLADTNAAQILRELIDQREWLVAAYFASTSGRWFHFLGLLGRAALSGEPWREVVALGLLRLVWPVWKRAFVGIARLSLGRGPVPNS